MVLTDVIDTIKTKAENIPFIQQVFMHPMGADVYEEQNGRLVRTGTRVNSFPALIFAPSNFDNQFSTTESNHRTFNFNAWLIINAENIENVDIYERVLPNAVDGVLKKFDRGWDFGTVNGSRVWARMASGSFGITLEDNGRQVWCEMMLTVRADVDIDPQ